MPFNLKGEWWKRKFSFRRFSHSKAIVFDYTEEKYELMIEVLNDSRLAFLGRNINEAYSDRLTYIKQTKSLTKDEKRKAKWILTVNKDFYNIVRYKGPQYNCKRCHREGYSIMHCEHCVRNCFVRAFNTWTSGSRDIDEAIQNAQKAVPVPKFIVEWIPYDQFSQIEYFKAGGCATIYTAVWTQGEIVDFVNKKQTFIRKNFEYVILKRLKNSHLAEEDSKFFKELKTHISLRCKGYRLVHTLGVTKDPTTDEYILVLSKMKQDLRGYIQENYGSITWRSIFRILWIVSETLSILHNGNLVHRDLHSGNILFNSGLWFISDLGLCVPADQPLNSIYGNLPYVSPETIRGGAVSTKVDVYSFGMLMYEITHGHSPFHNRKHDANLSLDIINGIRPTIDAEIRDDYLEMMKSCWNDDPALRPNASELMEFFSEKSQAVLKGEINGDACVILPDVRTVFSTETQTSAIHYSPHSKNATDSGQNELDIPFDL